jgi:hypothetical protein
MFDILHVGLRPQARHMIASDCVSMADSKRVFTDINGYDWPLDRYEMDDGQIIDEIVQAVKWSIVGQEIYYALVNHETGAPVLLSLWTVDELEQYI